MEREKFEKDFGDAFKGAEQSPSENVWVNIELELERAEGKKMKQRVLFYQMLAAASITFALILTGAGILVLRNSEGLNTSTIASNVPADGRIGSVTDLSNNVTEGTPSQADSSFRPDPSLSQATLESNGISDDPDKASSSEFLARTETNVGERSSHQAPKSHQADRDNAGIHQVNIGRVAGASPSPAEELSRAAGTTRLSESNRVEDSNAGDDALMPEPQPATKKEGSGTRDLPSLEELSADSELLATKDPGVDPNNDIQDSTSGNSSIAANDPVNQNKDKGIEVSSEPDPVALMFARLNDLEKELAEQGAGGKKNKNAGEEKIWTSVGFAAGGYNGQANAPVQANAFALNSAVESQAEASGVAYSVNISMGTRITNRLVLQGGVSYMNNSTSYTSNQVVRSENMDFKPATISDLRAAGSSLFDNNTVIPTAPHSVNNSMEFISIPVQAGYIIIDRKFGLQLNAGVATDFFIQNTIDAQGSGIQSTTQDRGADSPYRSTNFSGLMGTEFTYRLGDRYRVALNPGLRYPFSSIYKKETGIESTPLTFDVGLRFRYIFR